jgi:WD40 repeat protein
MALWDLSLGRRIRAIYCAQGDACTHLAFSPDGQYFVTQEDNHIDLFDGKTGSFLRRFAPDDWVITSYAFSPTGDLLAVIDRSPSLSIYAFPEGKLIASLSSDPRLDMVSAMSFSPDGKILAHGYNNGSYTFWDVASLQPVSVHISANEFYSSSRHFALTFSPDGTMLASQSYDNVVTLWSIP